MFLELEAEVDVEIDFLGEVAPADRAAKWTDDAVVGIAELGTPDGFVVEDMVQLFILLGDLSFYHQVVLLVQALLQLESCHQYLAIHGVAMSEAGKR